METIESFPDTTITLTNGKKYVVKEKDAEVVELMTEYFRKINLFAIKGLGENEDEE